MRRGVGAPLTITVEPSLPAYAGTEEEPAGERERERDKTCVGDAILPSPQQVPSSGGPLKAPTLVPRSSSKLSYSCPNKAACNYDGQETDNFFNFCPHATA